MDRLPGTVFAVQWIFATVLADSLMEASALARPPFRAVAFALVSVCGALSCFAVFRVLHGARHTKVPSEPEQDSTQHDDLTGLPNRTALHRHLRDRLSGAGANSAPVSCMYLDVDGLRHANALLGYRAGDELLRKIVARVANCLHPSDYLSRFGGDKFVVLLQRRMSCSELNALAECMVHTVSRPHTIANRPFTAGVSIGISVDQGFDDEGEALLAAAEHAMYQAKRSGRGNYRHAEQNALFAESRSAMLADRLQRAVWNDDLQLQYQPIFDRGGRVVAAEALTRWHDPELGSISPGEFIPIAEETGLIVPLSVWVLRRACQQMVRWRVASATLHRIAVNISVLQVAREDFVSTVQTVLQETGLPAECLELELTEGALARDFALVKAHLQMLRELGVLLSIDDFGTGYSSFGRLRDLNADALKIDRVFVQGAHETHNGVAVLQALIDMAHTLNLRVVAEGVETAEQMELLCSLRCNEMQGFLLARPQDPEQLSELLLSRGVRSAVATTARDEVYSGFALPGFA